MEHIKERTFTSETAVRRLTALWGLSEAGLGGLIHAMRIPFTGIMLASTAIVLITLIAYFAERRSRAILRATLIVLIIKATVSPHTPLPAYVAVLFQGALAALLFGGLRGTRLPAMLLGVLVLWQGGLQKFVTMTLVYGTSVWEAIDVLGQRLASSVGASASFDHASYWLIGIHALYYGIGGLVVGWLAGIMPGKIERQLAGRPLASFVEAEWESARIPKARRRWVLRRFLPALFLLALVVGVLYVTGGDEGWRRGWRVFIRAVLIVALWFGLMGPHVRALIQRFLQKRSAVCAGELASALEYVPRMRRLAAWAWVQTLDRNRFVRWFAFLKLLIACSLLLEDIPVEDPVSSGCRDGDNHP